MYEELVKAIRQNTCHFDACGMCPKRNALCMDRMALQAADAIEELSKPRWIPVTERLPEEVRKSYLCRTDSGYHCEVRWTDNVYGLWTGGGGKWGWSIFDIPQYAKVTHWMPLPPAPKEESNGV